jgi:hypothetical protein
MVCSLARYLSACVLIGLGILAAVSGITWSG